MRKRTKWVLGLVAAGAAVAAAVFTFTSATQRTLQSELAETLRVDEATLFLNLPPMPKRYPGSVLTRDDLLPVNLVDSSAQGLEVGTPFRVSAATSSLREAGGSVAAEIFDEVTRSEDLLELVWSLEDGHVIEMGSASMLERLAPYRSDPELFCVVTRAFVARLKLSVRCKTDATAQAWVTLQERVKATAADGSDAKVEVSARSSEDSRMEISLTAPTVVAFQTCRLADYVGSVGAPPAVKATDVRAPTAQSVDALLRLDPKLAPSLEDAIRQIGPDADRAITDAIEKQTDPEQLCRATDLLQRTAKPSGRAVAKARPTTPESDQVERARKAAAAASDASTSVATLAGDLKPDRDRAVQLIALGALARRGTDAASAEREIAALLRNSPDAAVRTAAEHTLRRVRGEATKKPPGR
jgi:hypothetical protein